MTRATEHPTAADFAVGSVGLIGAAHIALGFPGISPLLKKSTSAVS